MKQALAERVYDEAVKPLSVTERLWLVERIIGELRRHSTESGQGPAPRADDSAPRREWSERFRAALGQLDPSFERPAPLPSVERESLGE